MILIEGNFDKFIPLYYKHIISWLGLKSSRVNTRLVGKLGKHFGLIHQSRGINQVITRLKISSIAVLQYISGNPLTTTQELGQRVKLVAGLPAFLPTTLRTMIRSKNLSYIRVIVSLLHAYKGLQGTYKDPYMSYREISHGLTINVKDTLSGTQQMLMSYCMFQKANITS
jgi:hypothetical protein